MLPSEARLQPPQQEQTGGSFVWKKTFRETKCRFSKRTIPPIYSLQLHMFVLELVHKLNLECRETSLLEQKMAGQMRSICPAHPRKEKGGLVGQKQFMAKSSHK